MNYDGLTSQEIEDLLVDVVQEDYAPTVRPDFDAMGFVQLLLLPAGLWWLDEKVFVKWREVESVTLLGESFRRHSGWQVRVCGRYGKHDFYILAPSVRQAVRELYKQKRLADAA